METTDDELIDVAIEALERAYAPYSNFAVGAALLDVEGRVFRGVNVENASLGLSICAERNALFHAVAAGAAEIQTVVVATRSVDLTPPCGACRQVLQELAPRARIVLVNERRQTQEVLLSDLLPHPFQDFRPKEPGS